MSMDARHVTEGPGGDLLQGSSPCRYVDRTLVRSTKVRRALARRARGSADKKESSKQRGGGQIEGEKRPLNRAISV